MTLDCLFQYREVSINFLIELEDASRREPINDALPQKKDTKFHRVIEKLDGSIMMLFYHKKSNKFRVMTRSKIKTGQAGAMKGVSFEQLFEKLLEEK